ncbi:MAG TPA: nicotinate-nicotinamide nucleotide adenylyltransferase [Candidatus Saccharimonadales bacterium]|nr:nicotinate-nicotinamide nucleotide adenylyltransferase [Candidatus Saccharimonadales bacterium]
MGIYSGTFNPVHAGHIAFALQAIQTAKLDKLYFLPERKPRYKVGVEHFAHRVAMLKAAARPHARLAVLELHDISFSVQRTLPQLQQRFPGSQLVFVVGSDVAQHLPDWPHGDRLLAQSEVVIGLRTPQNRAEIERLVGSWPQQPLGTHIIDSFAPHISSGTVREALRTRRYTAGLLRSVAQYSNRHWLYVSVA